MSALGRAEDAPECPRKVNRVVLNARRTRPLHANDRTSAALITSSGKCQ
jgi:hypothetical protein